MQGLSPVVASGGHSSSRCAGLSPSQPLLSRSTGSRRAGSVIVAHGPSRSAACGILPDQGSNLCPLHRQADSQPLRHQGSPVLFYVGNILLLLSQRGPQNNGYWESRLSGSGPTERNTAESSEQFMVTVYKSFRTFVAILNSVGVISVVHSQKKKKPEFLGFISGNMASQTQVGKILNKTH